MQSASPEDLKQHKGKTRRQRVDGEDFSFQITDRSYIGRRDQVQKSRIAAHENKALLGFVWKKDYLPLPRLMLSGGGTVSPLRCRCRRSNSSIAR